MYGYPLPYFLDSPYFNSVDAFGLKIHKDEDPYVNLYNSRLLPQYMYKILNDRYYNYYVVSSDSPDRKLSDCKLSDENRKNIRKQMKENILKEKRNLRPDSITITFAYKCAANSGREVVAEYRDKIRNAVNATEGTKRVIFNPNTFDHEVLINGPIREGWETVKKYNKSDSNITKIKVYLNKDEYKEIPYQGIITDEYHKILFTSSFDMFPTKKIKN